MEVAYLEIFKIALGLVNSLSLMFVIAFLLSRTKSFRSLVLSEHNTIYSKIFLSIIFGLFGILGTYYGFPVDGAIANSRAVGVIVAGLLGGPFVGIGAALISGIHRWAIDIGGFTALACMVSTIAEGIVGSLGHRYMQRVKEKWFLGFYITIFAEMLQMSIILLMARPFSSALILVEKIAIPMTIVNSIGVSLFIVLLESIYKEQQREAAIQSELALKIADKTLSILRNGLNKETALEACKIIHSIAKVDAVAITQGLEILAHVGVGSEHHLSGGKVRAYATNHVLISGSSSTVETSEGIGCMHDKCKLKSAIIVPLVNKEHVIGVLKIYKTKENAITSVDKQLAEGLANLFSTQIGLAEADYNSKLLAKAELRALQAQIHPHFLFNTLNTIVSLCRLNPETARKLLINLGSFLRESFKEKGDLVELESEIAYIDAYLEIEKARFGDKLRVEYEISNVNFKLPNLILQPLVENAVKHGIYPKKEGGTIKIAAIDDEQFYTITVADNGVGFDSQKITPKNTGIGIKNVDKRLKATYGKEWGLKINSTMEIGTSITINIPKRSA